MSTHTTLGRPPVRAAAVARETIVLTEEERSILAAVLTAPRSRRQKRPDDFLEDDNRAIPAGYTYLGQFINHDITPSTRPAVGGGAPPSAALDLDSLYGRGGPDAQPHLYARKVKSRWHLRLSNAVGGSDVDVFDFYREPETDAAIGEPRNDENFLIAQLHSSFSMFHNRMLDDLVEREFAGEVGLKAFEAARTAVRWHFQWLVLWDYLPRISGGVGEIRTLVDQLLAGMRIEDCFTLFREPRDAGPFIPDVFARAAFRFGHAMVRPSYFLNDQAAGPMNVGLAAIHEPIPLLDARGGFHREMDLRGRQKIPAEWGINWQYFFPFDVPLSPWDEGARYRDGSAPAAFPGPQASMLIKARLLPAFAGLPQGDGGPPSLILRDLIAGDGLPSGQALAAKAGLPALDPADLRGSGRVAGRTVGVPHELRRHTPLFYYVLKEAEKAPQCGAYLGSLGRRIVIETLVGNLWRDRGSFLRQSPGWMPKPPVGGAIAGQPYTMAHFLKYAYGLEANPVPPWPPGVPPI